MITYTFTAKTVSGSYGMNANTKVKPDWSETCAEEFVESLKFNWEVFLNAGSQVGPIEVTFVIT